MAFLRRHRLATAVAGVGLLGLALWLAFGFFGIQAAFIDDEVDQAGPVFASGAQATDEPAPEPITDEQGNTQPTSPAPEPITDEQGNTQPTSPAPEPITDEQGNTQPTGPAPEPVNQVVTLVRGDFTGSGRYDASGQALVLNDGTEQRFLRFENFATDNGPDLKVYLSSAPVGSDSGAFDDDIIDLGDLAGNIGDQNYEIPPSVDLERYSTVVIWCERFSALFATAALS